MSFYVLLPSNAAVDSHTASSFTIYWDTAITFIGKWEVALTEYAFACPKEFKPQSPLYIYASLVEPILVGNTRVPLMRQIWLNNDDDIILHDILDHTMYLPLASSCINNVEIQVRNDKGDLIEFPQGTKTSLTLHFQQQQ